MEAKHPYLRGLLVNIIDAVDDQNLFKAYFKDPATWQAWRACLCALFGLPMSKTELETYTKCTGRKERPENPFREAWLICGRRAGKSFNLALIAVFLATFKDWAPYLTSGERGTIVIVAADRRQARTIMGYIRALLLETPMLRPMVVKEAAEEIDLDNRITIEVATCSFRTIRGRTIVAALCDEIAYWMTEGSANPDEEILAAIRPAMATIPNSMLLCASSPYARRGVMWEAFQRWHGVENAPALVWQCDTRGMNPTVSEEFIAKETERDPSKAAAEYGACFRSDVERLLTKEAITACIAPGIFERLPDRRHGYVGFVDPSGGSNDSFTLAIAHREGVGKTKTAVLDLVRERVPPFSPEQVVQEFAGICKNYRISLVYGDRYGGEWVAEKFRLNGINYEPAERSKSELFGDLVSVINSRAVDLLDNAKMAGQLTNLERRSRSGGKDLIDHPPGGHDDLANAVAGAVLGVDAASAGAEFHRRIEYPKVWMA
jgi:hypothetical protein